jgi:phosphopantetheine--protein transferase-like protein
MTLGIGVDITRISTMRDVLERKDAAFIRRVFTEWERARSENHPDRAAYLAMTFAAKEAVFKTFGIGWESGVQINEIEVRDGQWGEPIPYLSGRFDEIAREKGVSRVLVSLSYDGDYAIAMATLT